MRSLLLVLAVLLGAPRVPAQPTADRVPGGVILVVADPESEEALDGVFLSGTAGYFVGAGAGVALSYALVPADSVRGHRVPLRIAAGVAGGTLAAVAGVYIANGFAGDLPKMVGGALLGQAIGLGAAGLFVLADVGMAEVFGAREPSFAWMGMAVVLGTPFYASLGADYWGGPPDVAAP